MIIIHTKIAHFPVQNVILSLKILKFPLGKIPLFRNFEFGKSGKTAIFPSQTGAWYMCVYYYISSL